MYVGYVTKTPPVPTSEYHPMETSPPLQILSDTVRQDLSFPALIQGNDHLFLSKLANGDGTIHRTHIDSVGQNLCRESKRG
jgi:hypothetical protein